MTRLPTTSVRPVSRSEGRVHRQVDPVDRQALVIVEHAAVGEALEVVLEEEAVAPVASVGLVDVVGANNDADDGPRVVRERRVHDVEVAPPVFLAGQGAGDDALAGEHPFRVGEGGLAVGGHGLVVGKAAAEGDLGAVEFAHDRRVRPVEGGVAQLAVEGEAGQVIGVDDCLDTEVPLRHARPSVFCDSIPSDSEANRFLSGLGAPHVWSPSARLSRGFLRCHVSPHAG